MKYTEHNDIIVDLDDVLAHLGPTLAKVINDHTGSDIPVEDWHTFDLMKLYPMLDVDQFDQLVINTKIMEQLEPIPSAIWGMNLLSSRGFRLHVVTARGFHPNAHDLSSRWLRQHRVPYDTLSVSKHGESKSDVYSKVVDTAAFMFDDNLDNIKDAEQSGIVESPILITQPWNKLDNKYAQGVNRFNCLGEFCFKMRM